MRILLVHNYYIMPGGEDHVFNAEVALLRHYGHEVSTWTQDNRQLADASPVQAALNTIWSRTSQRSLKEKLLELRPDIVHFHNTFLAISPAAYYTCQEAKVPVVQTLHNFRLLCPAATLFRDGRICEDCLGGRGLWPSIQHRCWHSSRPQTAVVSAMLVTHRWLKTWHKQVNVFIALNEFARQKFIDGGLPADKIVVKPNFLASSPPPSTGSRHSTPYVMYAGRLSPEKGCELLLQAWRALPSIPLKIFGDGPLLPQLQQYAQEHGLTQVEFVGRRSQDEILEAMQHAHLLVVPSLWYEGMPMVVLEAFSRRLPVLVSNVGALAELVHHKINGLNFTLNDATDLAKWVNWSWEHPADLEEIADKAYRDFQERYSADHNYQQLIAIYQRAMAQSSSRAMKSA